MREIKDFLSLYNDSLFYAKTNREAIKLLNKIKFDYVIIDFAMYNEFKLIKYINDNHKNVKIILTMSRDLQEIISTIKNGKYHVIVQPFRLSELKKQLD
jgi:DNA-binding response OmpR family regulator